MYTSTDGVFSVDKNFVKDVEPLLLDNKVSSLAFLNSY